MDNEKTKFGRDLTHKLHWRDRLAIRMILFACKLLFTENVSDELRRDFDKFCTDIQIRGRDPFDD